MSPSVVLNSIPAAGFVVPPSASIVKIQLVALSICFKCNLLAGLSIPIPTFY